MVVTSTTITDLLRKRHQPPEWACFDELRGGTGYGLPGSEQYLDTWAINCYAGKQWRRIAYEIKISRADFLREIRDSLKRRHAFLLSNQFFFVAPAGIISVSDLPLSCGLIEVCERPIGLVLKETVSAPWRDVAPPSWCFVAALARRIQKGGEG
jgi:hypothetical protein